MVKQNKFFLINLLKGIANRAGKLFYNPYNIVNINPVKLKVLKHLPPGETKQHKMMNGVLSYTNPQELLHGLKEIFVDQIYKVHLPANAYIIDGGANIGLSVIYLKKLFPDARIIAFEPDETNFELLSSNVSSFKLNNVELKKEALWVENTTISFSNEGSMSSKIETGGTSKKVKAARLKDYLDRKIDFLKIDIEGAEYAVLKDIHDSLHQVSHMFLEYHGKFHQNKELVEMLQLIEKAGFSFYIKEAASIYDQPFFDAINKPKNNYDVQLNIFCFRVTIPLANSK